MPLTTATEHFAVTEALDTGVATGNDTGVATGVSDGDDTES